MSLYEKDWLVPRLASILTGSMVQGCLVRRCHGKTPRAFRIAGGCYVKRETVLLRKVTTHHPPSSHNTSNMARRRIKKAFNLDLPQHKRAHIEDNAQDELQVIGAGLPRSGTTSLKAALEILGFDPCHHMSAGLHQNRQCQ